MAHYAFIKDDIVTEVIVGKDETETTPDGFTSWEEYYITIRPDQDYCKRTSYNTEANQHKSEGTPFRGNYASIGYTYDSSNDVFYKPQPYASWILNDNWVWEAPISYPTDGNFYEWNEETTSWDLVE